MRWRGQPIFAGVQNARSKFDARFTATTSFQTANIPVQIKGVGMFDFLHGQTGVAPNGIELHPVLDIIFNPGNPTPDFAVSASPTAVSVTQGGTRTTTISTTVSGGFNSAVSLSASGLPAGVTASFSPTSIACSRFRKFHADIHRQQHRDSRHFHGHHQMRSGGSVSSTALPFL